MLKGLHPWSCMLLHHTIPPVERNPMIWMGNVYKPMRHQNHLFHHYTSHIVHCLSSHQCHHNQEGQLPKDKSDWDNKKIPFRWQKSDTTYFKIGREIVNVVIMWKTKQPYKLTNITKTLISQYYYWYTMSISLVGLAPEGLELRIGYMN